MMLFISLRMFRRLSSFLSKGMVIIEDIMKNVGYLIVCCQQRMVGWVGLDYKVLILV
jgi:hypothetical protein